MRKNIQSLPLFICVTDSECPISVLDLHPMSMKQHPFCVWKMDQEIARTLEGACSSNCKTKLEHKNICLCGAEGNPVVRFYRCVSQQAHKPRNARFSAQVPVATGAGALREVSFSAFGPLRSNFYLICCTAPGGFQKETCQHNWPSAKDLTTDLETQGNKP